MEFVINMAYLAQNGIFVWHDWINTANILFEISDVLYHNYRQLLRFVLWCRTNNKALLHLYDISVRAYLSLTYCLSVLWRWQFCCVLTNIHTRFHYFEISLIKQLHENTGIQNRMTETLPPTHSTNAVVFSNK
jgi:hypothetical protein